MNKNVKIAKELLKLAKSIMASEDDYASNVIKYIDECFNMNYVVGTTGIKYNVRYDNNKNFKLVALEGGEVPENEHVDEEEIMDMYNDAVRELKTQYHTIDGYDDIETDCWESNENHYMLNNEDFEIDDEDGELVDVSDDFRQEVADDAKDECFRIINYECLVDEDTCIKFFNSNGSDTGIIQELKLNGYEEC